MWVKRSSFGIPHLLSIGALQGLTLPGQAFVADNLILNDCDFLPCLMTVSQCYKWEQCGLGSHL